MSEAFARDCQSEYANGENEPSCCGKNGVNDKEVSEPFAREQRKVNGGH